MQRVQGGNRAILRAQVQQTFKKNAGETDPKKVCSELVEQAKHRITRFRPPSGSFLSLIHAVQIEEQREA